MASVASLLQFPQEKIPSTFQNRYFSFLFLFKYQANLKLLIGERLYP
jgi:hypothetical protein